MDSAPSGSREDEAKAPWHEAAFEQAADPSSTFEAIQRKVAEMMEELADKRAAVRERQLELKRLRADASAEVSRRAAAYERKAKESAKSHGAAVERQTVLLAKMRGDVTHLRGRAAELQKQSSSAAAVRASRLERLTDELDDSARLAREQWSATETKDLSRVVEKRRDAVKAKVIKALEPEVHRLISANRDDAQKRRESDARWLSQQRCDLEAAHEADLALERRKVEDDLEEDLAGLRRRNSDKLRQLHQRAERDVPPAPMRTSAHRPDAAALGRRALGGAEAKSRGGARPLRGRAPTRRRPREARRRRPAGLGAREGGGARCCA